jgi:hypothetical protein
MLLTPLFSYTTFYLIFIPYNRYIEDRHWDSIRGFIKTELVDVFNFQFCSKTFNGDTVKYARLKKYIVPNDIIKRYNNNPRFLNSITKSIVKNSNDFKSIVKEKSDFDNNPYEINTLNGIFYIKLKNACLILLKNS